jgi:hypothetical protein
MTRSNALRFAAALFLGSASTLASQAPSPNVAISVAAAKYVRATLARTGVMAINAEQYQTSEEFVMGHGQPLHAENTVEAFLGLPDVRVARQNDVIKCESGPSTCRMIGADAFVAISAPIIHEDKSIVNVVYQYQTGLPGVPVAYEKYRLEIMLENGEWKVQRRVLTAQS